MPFVIRAFDKVGAIGWVTPASTLGFRMISSREAAEQFAEAAHAQATIAQMPSIFADMGFRYEVESISLQGPVINP